MKSLEQLNAIIPPGNEDKPELVKAQSETQKENPRKAEEPYIVIGEKSVSYLGVEVPKGEGGRLTPSEAEFKEEYFYIEGHYQAMREVATALLLNKPILLEGGTGVYNKTTTIARMCRDLNMNYCKVNFDRETAREDVIGGQTLKVDENGKEKLEWYDGDLMYAIRHGGVAFLDEYNRQSKIAGIINPIMDAILNGRKEITNPYNENERVKVHPNFRLVAAQNPPGFEEGHEYTDRSQLPAETFGRWLYRKLPIAYSEAEENKLLAGVIGEKVDIDLPKSEFRQTGEGLSVRELADIPGMVHWRKEIINIVRVIEAKSTGAKREMAKGQRQSLYFNPRLIMSTIPQYIAHFYRGDINETVKNAFETCVIGMYGGEEDKQKIRLLLDQASWKPSTGESKRKGLEKKPKKPVKAGVEEKPKEDAEEGEEESRDTDGEKSEAEKALEKAEEEIGEMKKAARKKKREMSGESGEIFEPKIEVEYRSKDKDGKEKTEKIKINLEEKLEYSSAFYKEHGIDLPADFTETFLDIWERNYDAIRETMKEKGFDEVLLIPEGLSLPDLHSKMSEGYNPTYQGDYFKEGGSFEGVEEKKKGPRIVFIHKNNAQNVYDRPELDAERGKTAEELMKRGEDLTLTGWLIFQRQYFETTKKHIDENGWTWLPGSTVKKKGGGFRVVSARWRPVGGQLDVGASDPGDSYPYLGCRLSRSFS